MLWVGQIALRRHASELGADLLGIGLGGVARVVADHQVVFGIHAGAGELLELHLHELALVAQLDNAILKLSLCLLHDLEARENTGNVGERNVVIELEAVRRSRERSSDWRVVWSVATSWLTELMMVVTGWIS